ncbi:clathrin coat assembly protein AP180 isoform X1 [Gadus morhua]|uniref:Clathrin coat assembly protein AP180-like n=1 Tax=Gadus morhua TaxID=8049 RepID=A0A8C5BDV9_GADMO|nr:clathrin coat assembly protein AP180-like isoform X1 [Gadus morhua]XP_030201505.1 clathrin coat assembly protein AP180-like isoform X1 [Gadus morhua]XP_030201506.1 clathrin coat assembly protein AP180-like isoform X1 [Gadus morhua]XP_030201507.1 clathrin coat assembly protein AP180-like isoform X1 [Gadus morhua]XP_030201508.1 clathrin coat assembly protein AP180-like isoform X1 [Gadus morhua]
MSGQTLTDRIAAAQYQLTGSDMARGVCKATTHEVMAPKKKHLEYLVGATNATNVNIPQMADTLFERATNASWVVVFKALVTSHHMCVHGNERFIQYLASRTSLFNLSNFIDKTGSHGYDMSTFIRRYGRYLNEKAFAYRQMAFDFTKVKKGADGVMRTMTTEKLLKGMPVLQTQIDTLLEFDVHPKELNNGIINAAFLLLFKDLVKLFASYNDGVINLLEKYFKMKKGDCKEALEIYKRFLTRVTKIGEFMKMAETIGVDKNDIPDINYAPSSILESLETHMNGLEDVKGGKKGSPSKGSPTNNVSPTSTPAKSSNAVPTLQPPPGEAAGAAAAAAAAAPEPVEDSLLDLDPLSSSGPSGPSAAPTSWGDLLGSEMGDSLLSEPTLTAEAAPPSAGATPTPAPTPTAAAAAAAAVAAVAADTGVSLAPPTSTAAVASSSSPSNANMDLLGDAFSSPAPAAQTPAAQAPATADGGAPAPPPAAGAAADMFDAMPDTNVSGAEAAPSVDLFAAGDMFSSPAPNLSSTTPSKMDSGAIMNLFGEPAGAEATPLRPRAQVPS